MKYLEQDRINQTEEVTVYKLGSEGGRGPQGDPGTIGTLDLLTNKPVVIPADLALVGDSAASFANKNSTWQQLIDTVLSLFANNISDADATALTDGGETALHSHAGGGGAGQWTEISRQEITSAVASVDFIDKLTDDYDIYRVRVEDAYYTGGAGALAMLVGSGVGPTWVESGYCSHNNKTVSSSTSYSSFIANGTGTDIPLQQVTNNMRFSGTIELHGVRDTARGMAGFIIDGILLHATFSTTIFASGRTGVVKGATVFDHLRFFDSASGATLSQGLFVLEGGNI